MLYKNIQERGLYEDDVGDERLLDKYIKSFIATKAMKIKISG